MKGDGVPNGSNEIDRFKQPELDGGHLGFNYSRDPVDTTIRIEQMLEERGFGKLNINIEP